MANFKKVNSSTKETEVKISVDDVEVSTEGEETLEVIDTETADTCPPEEKVEESTETPEITVEEPTESSEITVSVNTEDTVKVAERYVAVKLQKNYHCTIGGITYTFESGKRYNVPTNVKEVLLKEPNLLLPL